MDKIKKRLIVALDVEDEVKAFDIVEELKDEIDFFKVGLELFLAEGKKMVNVLQAVDKKVFLDLKLFDIPNTVYGATKQALKLNPQMLTLHCLGGTEMLKSAVKAKKETNSQTKLLGVTLLTSMEASDLGYNDDSEVVLKMAQRAKDANLDGIICSPTDVSMLRQKIGKDILMVCPGIRFNGPADDQKRVGSPRETIKNGADYLVVGRPIVKAQSRLTAAREIIKSIIKNN
jgi:orotidine-5'-phosphate decarboxylase